MYPKVPNKPCSINKRIKRPGANSKTFILIDTAKLKKKKVVDFKIVFKNKIILKTCIKYNQLATIYTINKLLKRIKITLQ
jgi:hypothetical protein